MTAKYNDRRIKAKATEIAKKQVFDDMYEPKDLYVDCSDGRWVRRVYKFIGGFMWLKWEKLE